MKSRADPFAYLMDRAFGYPEEHTLSTLLERVLPDDELLVPDKVAASILGLDNPKTLANWRSQRRNTDLEFIRIGRNVRYRLGTLRAFLKSKTIKG